MHRRAIPGKGVDCVRFVLSVLAESGIIESPKKLPSYPVTWGLTSTKNAIGGMLDQCIDCERIEEPKASELAFGDIVIFNVGRQSNHIGIAIDRKLWHVIRGGEVHGCILQRHEKNYQEAVRIKREGWIKLPNEINFNQES